ncbi:hypothetical protein EYF80_017951 [Liparis tanakae]|uniref:Uncharacterized protein n=1 Tax=Liparis tanakae TaxID=230148 RepID=A0A4Z2I1S4_9TELE|nr:hypothetical protein EYF80_017951 [Liparis tanakae]
MIRGDEPRLALLEGGVTAGGVQRRETEGFDRPPEEPTVTAGEVCQDKQQSAAWSMQKKDDEFHIPAHTRTMKAKNRDQSLSDSRELDGSYDQLTGGSIVTERSAVYDPLCWAANGHSIPMRGVSEREREEPERSWLIDSQHPTGGGNSGEKERVGRTREGGKRRACFPRHKHHHHYHHHLHHSCTKMSQCRKRCKRQLTRVARYFYHFLMGTLTQGRLVVRGTKSLMVPSWDRAACSIQPSRHEDASPRTGTTLRGYAADF